MSGINRISEVGVVAVVVYNSPVHIAIFINRTGWYAVEVRTTKELTYHARVPTGSPNHSTFPNLFRHCLSKLRNAFCVDERTVIIYCTLWCWWVIVEMANEPGCKTFQNVLFHR